jgi:hypothetical protein
MWGDCTRSIYMPQREPPSIASSTGWHEGIRNPRREGRGGHQHDGDFFHFHGKAMATLPPAWVHHGSQPGAAEKASIYDYATSWARGLGLLDE